MYPRALSRTALLLGAVLITVTAPMATAAQARPTQAQPTAKAAPATSRVFTITENLARQVAMALADPATRDRFTSAVAAGPADLMTIKPDPALTHKISAANQAVLVAKGLPASSGSVLRVRLADPQQRAALDRDDVPLVAATPTDDTTIALTAYDQHGHATALSAANPPQQPVLLVEVDVAKALPLGLPVMRDELARAGITDATSALATTVSAMTATTNGYWATKVDAIRLSDDKEPWFKGAAEIFDIVTGFGLDGTPKVDIVQMPYLDYDGVTYYPNQLLVHFSAYKYDLADVVMYEDDGDTNYQSLAQALADALLTITDQGMYVPLVDAIIQAMPSSWWTDDPDYVDSWYTLATTSSGRLYGAAANGWMDVEPYWVSAL